LTRQQQNIKNQKIQDLNHQTFTQEKKNKRENDLDKQEK
jgi:hypothetical protein